ncbi:MAG: type IX secretion system sortase PorU [Chitinophagaceae bacterium]
MNLYRFLFVIGSVLATGFSSLAQRNYAPNSVLASGSWYKISIAATGIYKIDVPFLNNLGINTSALASASVRLFGNGGGMLSEANNGQWTDNLVENSIQVNDGGDGVINGSDYILFYANGPDEWLPDQANLRFTHRKNIYNDKSYYFLNIGGNGKRIVAAPVVSSPNITVNIFSERYFHELDTINFFASGKEWFGEELSALPGRSLIRTFNFSIPGLLSNTPLLLNTNCVARSVGVSSKFDIKINEQAAGQLTVGPVGGGAYDLIVQQSTGLFTGNTAQNNSISFNYTPGSFNSQGWINWFEVFTRRALSLTGNDQLFFRDWLSVGNNVAEFIISGATSGTQVWDITIPQSPKLMQGILVNNEFRFNNSCAQLKEYAAFKPTNFLTPAVVGKVTNQDLHNLLPVDYIIITHASLLPQAQRLAQLHQQQNSLRTLVVSTEQVFNEFAGGSADPVAIRDFVKMYHDKFGNTPSNKLKYLLLFGDASYDYKERINGNTNYVPAWQTSSSIDPLTTYVSDDFFGFLDDNEDINSAQIINMLDIGIGRVPARNPEEAGNFVDKVTAYFNPKSLGPWRNNLTFIADDEDNNLHLQDAELITTTANSVAPEFNQQKIYLDAFRQETNAGGSIYPQANQEINNQILNGTLIWNFNGHGGYKRLAEETILDQQIVNNWNNNFRLPLFITATCDFAPFDNPDINSLGENILLRPRNGAIGLMTTTRIVFAFSNRIMNNNYLQFALQQDVNGKYKTLGDAVKDAKNYTYQTFSDIANNRKFTLLGDPALTLAFPEFKINISKVNGVQSSIPDTLSASEKVLIEGEVTDQTGALLSSFNGNVYPVVFDKIQTEYTLANDPGSQVAGYQTRNNILFKGKSSVINGKFSFAFTVPRDINYQFGNGKLSLYAENGGKDAKGVFTNYIVGGAGINNSGDNLGPQLKAFLNDELFVNGGITNQQPILLVKLTDSSGINTVGTGIGHDIVATLDNDNHKYFVLNDFFQGELNSYQQGFIRFQLPVIEPGPHVIKIKAWDVLNNSSEAILEFTVVKDGELELNHVLNYPNPFTTNTSFWFEHNKPGIPLQVQLQVMTITGKVIKTFSREIITPGNRSEELSWDGKDDFGDKPGRGIYLYKLKVVAPDKSKKVIIGKMVMF